METLAWIIPGGALLAAIYMDSKYRKIPKALVIPLFAGGFIYTAVLSFMDHSFSMLLMWPVVVTVGFVLVSIRSKFVMPIGGGDIKLIVALCGWLGSLRLVLIFILAGVFFTGIYHLINHAVHFGMRSVLFNIKAELISCGQLVGDYKPMPGAYAISSSYIVTLVLQNM